MLCVQYGYPWASKGQGPDLGWGIALLELCIWAASNPACAATTTAVTTLPPAVLPLPPVIVQVKPPALPKLLEDAPLAPQDR